MKQEKKQALTEFHRRSILEAAEKLFLAQGQEATSIDDIAKASGYSKATLYVYFKSKADIWNNILLSSIRALQVCLDKAIMTEVGTIARYYAVCHALLKFSEDYPLYFEGILSKLPYEDDEELAQLHEAREGIDRVIGLLIMQGIEEGVTRPDVKIPHVGIYMWSAVTGMIRVITQKDESLVNLLGVEKSELFQYGIETLFQSISVRESEK